MLFAAIGQVMLYVDGMNGVINHNETVQWLYSLTASKVCLVRLETTVFHVGQFKALALVPIGLFCLHPFHPCNPDTALPTWLIILHFFLAPYFNVECYNNDDPYLLSVSLTSVSTGHKNSIETPASLC